MKTAINCPSGVNGHYRSLVPNNFKAKVWDGITDRCMPGSIVVSVDLELTGQIKKGHCSPDSMGGEK